SWGCGTGPRPSCTRTRRGWCGRGRDVFRSARGRSYSRLVNVVELFHDVVETVPAYRAFLAEHGVDPAAVQTCQDFAGLPMTSKDSYIRRHPLPDLCRHGLIGDIIAVSSGSTGEPAFWPRSTADEHVIA